jgi:hypothetical protein
MRIVGYDSNPVTYDELPSSLRPVRFIPLARKSPEKPREMAETKPAKTVPLPDTSHLTPGKAKRMANLAQYKGRSKEGSARSYANLGRRNMEQSNVKRKEVPEGMPQPKHLQLAVPDVPTGSLVRGRWLRAVTSTEEHNLYVDTWVEWMTAHKDEYDQPEDLMDLHRVCMEVVIQARLDLLSQTNPKMDNSVAYNQSFNRQQVARQNLTARRVDRTGTKANDRKNSLNIGIMVGSLDNAAIAQRRAEALAREAAVDDFLEGTVVASKSLPPANPKLEDQLDNAPMQ